VSTGPTTSLPAAIVEVMPTATAVSGSFSVSLDNGTERETYQLNRPYQGLLVDTGIWRTLDDFSSGAVCLVLAEDPYDEADYIYDYEEYLQSRR